MGACPDHSHFRSLPLHALENLAAQVVLSSCGALVVGGFSAGGPLAMAVTLHTNLGDIKMELFCDLVRCCMCHSWAGAAAGQPESSFLPQLISSPTGNRAKLGPCSLSLAATA